MDQSVYLLLYACFQHCDLLLGNKHSNNYNTDGSLFFHRNTDTKWLMIRLLVIFCSCGQKIMGGATDLNRTTHILFYSLWVLPI